MIAEFIDSKYILNCYYILVNINALDMRDVCTINDKKCHWNFYTLRRQNESKLFFK